MKITKQQLKQVIREQMEEVVKEPSSVKEEIQKLKKEGFKSEYTKMGSLRLIKKHKPSVYETIVFSKQNNLRETQVVYTFEHLGKFKFRGIGPSVMAAKDAAERDYDKFLGLLGIADDTLRR